MQSIQLGINGVIKAQGGLDVTNPLVIVSVDVVSFSEGAPSFTYVFSLYSTQEEVDNNNPFVVDKFAKMGKGGAMGYLRGQMSGVDFTVESDSNFNLTSTSLDSFKTKVIEHLAGVLEIDASTII
jgi:hypothetical protein